jgi:hypothetical protein
MEFVAVAGEHQPPTGMGTPGEGDNAHAALSRAHRAASHSFFAVQHGLETPLITRPPRRLETMKSQKLRLNMGLWIKLEQVSEDCCKSLTDLAKFPVKCC